MSHSDTNNLQKLSKNINEENCGVSLYLARKHPRHAEDDDDSPYKFGRVNIRGQMADHLENLVAGELKSMGDDLNDDEKQLDLAPYNIANKNRDEDLVQHLQFNEIDNSARFRPITEGDVDEEDSFKTYSNLNFIAIRLRPSATDTTITAFQTFTRRQVLKTDESLILSVFQNASSSAEEPVYEAEKETLYQLPYRVDAVYEDDVDADDEGDTVYVFDQRRFESIFDYYDEFRNAAVDVIEDLEDMEITINGMEHIETAYQDFPNAARLFYDVNELGRYENLDQNSLEYLYENFSPDTIVHTDGEYQLEATNRFDIWGILRVLNDSHLESSITDSRYISLSKQSTDGDGE